jgi:sec-independent protein translocase protein TatA
MGISLTHLVLLLIILLVVFGPSRLPSLGQSLGKAIKGFKDGLNEADGDSEKLLNKPETPIKQNDKV